MNLRNRGLSAILPLLIGAAGCSDQPDPPAPPSPSEARAVAEAREMIPADELPTDTAQTPPEPEESPAP